MVYPTQVYMRQDTFSISVWTNEMILKKFSAAIQMVDCQQKNVMAIDIEKCDIEQKSIYRTPIFCSPNWTILILTNEYSKQFIWMLPLVMLLLLSNSQFWWYIPLEYIDFSSTFFMPFHLTAPNQSLHISWRCMKQIHRERERGGRETELCNKWTLGWTNLSITYNSYRYVLTHTHNSWQRFGAVTIFASVCKTCALCALHT